MGHIQANAELAVRDLLKRVAAAPPSTPNGLGSAACDEGEEVSAGRKRRRQVNGGDGQMVTLSAEDYMDDGTKIGELFSPAALRGGSHRLIRPYLSRRYLCTG